MIEYGYINDGGYLVSRIITEIKNRYVDGIEVKERIVSISEQVADLSDNGWKPVEAIDESRLIPSDNDHIVRLVPFDNGDRISYRYESVYDYQKARGQILVLKEQLADGDYKIIKCYEANLLGNALPYSISDLHAERQELRNKINELELLLQ